MTDAIPAHKIAETQHTPSATEISLNILLITLMFVIIVLSGILALNATGNAHMIIPGLFGTA